ncbi:hypothetical protein niasHS_016207 [Heterodera schachtii]|uniref:Uncharacterized protein n=1 Tax=Heterodera schachtii TaxID=97005 RepID=A0ABD2HS28_HETSC
MNQTQQSAAKSAADRSMRKMLRSVFLVLFVLLIGWLISSAARNLITAFVSRQITLIIHSIVVSDTDTQNRLIANITSWMIGIITCFPILASASGAPILLLNSTDYRTAYKKAMGRRNNSPGVGPLFNAKVAVVPNVKAN